MRDKAALFMFAILAASVGLISGCSGIKTYPNNMQRNLFIETETDSGVRVSVHVHKVDAKCKASYVGTVFLKDKHSEIGIAPDRSSLLVFNFSRSSFWAGTSSSTGYRTLIRPRKGKVYKAKVIYQDDIYDVEIHESGSRRSKGSQIEQKPLSACRPL